MRLFISVSNYSRKLILFVICFLFSVSSYAQVPYGEISGRLSIYLPQDTTSLHIGRGAGINQIANEEKHTTYLGSGAGAKNTSGENNSFVGSYAGTSNETGENNSYFGFASGADNIAGNFNSFFGSLSGFGPISGPNEGNNNSYFGFGSGASTTTGSHNSFFGAESGLWNKSGASNVGVGANALRQLRSQSFNVAIGDSSMFYVGDDLDPLIDDFWGQKNVAVGHASLKSSNGGGSFNSVALGYHAGYAGAVNSVVVGYQAGPGLVSNSVLIGNKAGYGLSNIVNKLMITNAQDDTPLIYGEFDNDLIRINGDFEAEGYVKVKGYPDTSPPACSNNSHLGRMYYDLSRNRMRACTVLNDRNTTYPGWKDMHDNTPD